MDQPPQKRLYIKTYGCQMNVYDSERMADVLRPLGYGLTDEAEGADLVVLNTCHIREKAAEKVYSELGRIRRMKDRKAEAGGAMTVAVAGCVAQAEGQEMLRRAPVVDLVVGPQAYHQLPELIARTHRARGGRRFPPHAKDERREQPTCRHGDGGGSKGNGVGGVAAGEPRGQGDNKDEEETRDDQLASGGWRYLAHAAIEVVPESAGDCERHGLAGGEGGGQRAERHQRGDDVRKVEDSGRGQDYRVTGDGKIAGCDVAGKAGMAAACAEKRIHGSRFDPANLDQTEMAEGENPVGKVLDGNVHQIAQDQVVGEGSVGGRGTHYEQNEEQAPCRGATRGCRTADGGAAHEELW